MLPACGPAFELLPWHRDPQYSSVQAIIPRWPLWSREEETALTWSEEEHDKYGDPAYGSDARRLCVTALAPTALHSWGVALRPCPCGCRYAAFSDKRLRSGGLRGFGVVSQLTGQIRFPHAQEISLLNALSPAYVHVQDPRAALSLVGQLASPMQSAWVVSHVVSWAELHFLGHTASSPIAILQGMKSELLEERDSRWLTSHTAEQRKIEVRSSGALMAMQVAPACKVHQLLQAELKFADFGCKARLLSRGQVLSPSAFLHERPADSLYVLDIMPKRQAKDKPLGSVYVIVSCATGAEHVLLPAGSFMFEALPVDASCQRLQGRYALTGLPLALDSRVWDTAVVDIRPHFWHASAQSGVTDVAVAAALQHFVQPLFGSADCIMSPACSATILAAVQSGVLPQMPAILPSFKVQVMLVMVCQGAHWCVLQLQLLEDDTIQAVCLDSELVDIPTPVSALYEAIAMLWGKHARPLAKACMLASTAPFDCGTIAIAHAVCAASHQQTLPAQFLSEVQHFFSQFPAHWALAIGHGRLTEDERGELRKLLLDKGVPEAQVDERIKLAIERLGAPAATEALKAKNPWQALKGVASRPGCSFRWVLAEELQQHIAQRANQQHGTSIAKPKAKKLKGPDRKSAHIPLQVDPQHLQLVAGSFVAGSLCQLSFSEVTPQARGLAFCTAAQMAPFLASYKAMSVEALGLLATSVVPASAAAGAPMSTVRYPAVYMPTGEGIILSGSLLQLGDEEVHLSRDDIAEVEQVDTKVVKVSVFKDETTMSWAAMHQTPVRLLLQHVSELNLCKCMHCQQDCGKFHPAVEEVVESVVLDVWGRQWQKLEGGKIDPASASVFVAFLRVPGTAVALLQRVMYPGVYFEPRDTAGGVDTGFAVIWLPAADLQSARHTFQTCDTAIALTRLGRKYGVRVREPDEASTFERLRPSHDFVKVKMTARYRLFPLPFGFQRKGLLQLLRRWGWIARPLQPARGDATGTAWPVGAAIDPPAPLPLGDAYVLITKIKELQPPVSTPALWASARTRKHILLDDPDPADTDVDPWSNGRDPWSKAKPPHDITLPASQGSAASKLEQISTDLRKDMHQIVKEHVGSSSSDSATESRLHRLEVGLGEVKMQNEKFETWFATFGGKVSDLSGAVQSQKQEISHLRSEVQSSVASAVNGLQSDLTQQLSAQLAGQLEQIQAMFHKKHRPE